MPSRFLDVGPSGSRPPGRAPSVVPASWPLILALVVSALCLASGFRLPAISPLYRTLAGVVAVALLVIAIGVVLLGRHLWLVLTALVLVKVCMATLLATAPDTATVLILSYGVYAYVVYAAYALTWRLLHLYIALYVAALTVGTALSPAQVPLLTWFYLVVPAVAIALILGHLMRWLRWFAFTDSLTGVIDRGAFVDAVTRSLASSRRNGTPLSLAMVDVDNFKATNDAYGHAAGDQVLVDLVGEWRERLRGQDVIARIGGDEFAILLLGSSQRQAEEVMVALRASSTLDWSFGVAEAVPGDTAYALLHRADTAMYRAKRED